MALRRSGSAVGSMLRAIISRKLATFSAAVLRPSVTIQSRASSSSFSVCLSRRCSSPGDCAIMRSMAALRERAQRDVGGRFGVDRAFDLERPARGNPARIAARRSAGVRRTASWSASPRPTARSNSCRRLSESPISSAPAARRCALRRGLGQRHQLRPDRAPRRRRGDAPRMPGKAAGIRIVNVEDLVHQKRSWRRGDIIRAQKQSHDAAICRAH